MEKDSNLRRHRQQIYSLSPLATRESIRERVLLYTIRDGFASTFFLFAHFFENFEHITGEALLRKNVVFLSKW